MPNTQHVSHGLGINWSSHNSPFKIKILNDFSKQNNGPVKVRFSILERISVRSYFFGGWRSLNNMGDSV